MDSITGFAIGGSAFYLARLSQGSEVVWDRSGGELLCYARASFADWQTGSLGTRSSRTRTCVL